MDFGNSLRAKKYLLKITSVIWTFEKNIVILQQLYKKHLKP